MTWGFYICASRSFTVNTFNFIFGFGFWCLFAIVVLDLFFGFSWYNFSKRLFLTLVLFSFSKQLVWLTFFSVLCYLILTSYRLCWQLVPHVKHQIQSDRTLRFPKLSFFLLSRKQFSRSKASKKKEKPKRLWCLNVFQAALRIWYLRSSCLLGSLVCVVCS